MHEHVNGIDQATIGRADGLGQALGSDGFEGGIT
jgi:hypothetical protein